MSVYLTFTKANIIIKPTIKFTMHSAAQTKVLSGVKCIGLMLRARSTGWSQLQGLINSISLTASTTQDKNAVQMVSPMWMYLCRAAVLFVSILHKYLRMIS